MTLFAETQRAPSARYAFVGGGAFLLVFSHFIIVQLAPGLTHTTAVSLAVVAPFILLLSGSTLLLILCSWYLARLPEQKTMIWGMLATGALLRVMWFGSPAPIEDDFFRYLWDGAVLAHGFNPYTYSPEQAAMALQSGIEPRHLAPIGEAAKDTLSKINFPDLRSIYPGTAQVSFALAYWLAPFSLDGLRVVFLASELCTAFLLLRLLRAGGLNIYWAALYWCNPFVSAMLIGGAHVDALIPPFVLAAVLLLLRDRLMLAAASIGLAAGVKLWPVLLAPLILRHALSRPRKLGLAALALGIPGVVTILPLFLSAMQEGSGLTAYAKGWANNNAVFLWAAQFMMQIMPLDIALTLVRAAWMALAAGIALAVAWTPFVSASDLYRKALIVSGAAFYCSPAQFPWYASWFLPFTALYRFMPLIVVPALLPAYYLFFPLWETPHNAWFFYGVAFIHAVPIAGWLAWRASRHSRFSHPIALEEPAKCKRS